jgi:hypothetical protein
LSPSCRSFCKGSKSACRGAAAPIRNQLRTPACYPYVRACWDEGVTCVWRWRRKDHSFLVQNVKSKCKSHITKTHRPIPQKNLILYLWGTPCVLEEHLLTIAAWLPVKRRNSWITF